MFLQASVILSTGGSLPQCVLGYHPPQTRHPLDQGPPDQAPLRPGTPQTRHPPGPGTTPLDQAPPPQNRHHPGRRPPPPPGSRRQHTVNERPVRILLECILVCTVSPGHACAKMLYVIMQ